MPQYYKGLRDLLEALERKDKLIKITRPIIKETELMPLVRLQFRGLPEEKRKGFLFQNVVGANGRRYDASVAVGVIAGSREIYATGMNCEPREIGEKWTKALLNPIKPVLVGSAPCQEEVHLGEDLEKDGLDELPIPVNTPGFSGVIRTTDSNVITRDIETGILNCGCYAGKLINQTTIGLSIGAVHHGAIHWRKYRDRNTPMPVAIVVGPPPSVTYTSAVTVPYGISEYEIAGAIGSEPLELVKCKTIDLEVPAYAEIVIEGEASIDRRVGAAAYGEFTGYMRYGASERDLLMRVTAITHRKRPIYNVFFSQMPPSESSKVVHIGLENVYYKFLKHDCNIPGILEVAFPESSGGRMMCIIKMKKRNPSESWQALSAANGFSPGQAKIIIVVDEDIDPRDPESVNWALAFRMQPHRDLHVMRGRNAGLDYSAYRPDDPTEYQRFPDGVGSSSLMIDATLKWPYPPVSLPKKEYMDRAVQIWNELNLGPLKLREPWFGYNLGHWRKDDEENADFIVKGDYKSVGKKLFRDPRES